MISKINLQFGTLAFKSLLFSVVFCATWCNSVEAQITGGNVEDVQEGALPFVVSIGRNTIYGVNPEQQHFCGGSLISSKHVLTAAHCVENEIFKSNVIVLVGSPNLKSNKIRGYLPRDWITFSDWAAQKRIGYDRKGTDIAIITLVKEVEDIVPVSVSYPRIQKLERSYLTLAGWGLVNGNMKPSNLRQAILHLLPKKECVKRIEKLESTPDFEHASYICYVSRNPEDKILAGCGDSGSPILDTNNHLVAVHKGRLICKGSTDQVNLGLRTSYYQRFIKDFIGSVG